MGGVSPLSGSCCSIVHRPGTLFEDTSMDPPPCQHKSLREATRGCLDSHSLLDGRRRLTCTPFQSEPDAAPVRSSRRLKARFPAGPLRQIRHHGHHRPGRGDARTGGRPSPPRRDRECHPRPQARCGVEPSPLGPRRQLAGGTPSGWTARTGLGEQVVTTKTLRRWFFSLAGDHPLAASTASATALSIALIARPATCLTAAAATGAIRPTERPRELAPVRSASAFSASSPLSRPDQHSQTVTKSPRGN